MGSRLFWRRSATAVGLYTAMVLGILGTIVAARGFSVADFGLYATGPVAAGFFQSLLDLTVEDSLTKYGFRYVVAEDWGRLRRLFRRALELKLVGGVLAGVALLASAPLVQWIFGAEGLALPLVIASALPLAQAPENIATTAMLLRGRYDLRGLFLSISMGLRLLAITIGVQLGLEETIAGIGRAQVIATVIVAVDTGSWCSAASRRACVRARRGSACDRVVHAPVECGDGLDLAAQRIRAAPARHRSRPNAGRPVSGSRRHRRPASTRRAHRCD